MDYLGSVWMMSGNILIYSLLEWVQYNFITATLYQLPFGNFIDRGLNFGMKIAVPANAGGGLMAWGGSLVSGQQQNKSAGTQT